MLILLELCFIVVESDFQTILWVAVLDKDVVKRGFDLNCELNFNYSKKC